MPSFFTPLRDSTRRLIRIIGEWGRIVDRDYWVNQPPSHNPDPIDRDSTGKRYFQISQNPFVKAGLNFRDVSRLFVSAGGLEPDESGAYFPPQVIYTTPDKGNPEALNAIQQQYDEDFDGGFASILRSLHQPAMTYGRAIAEIDWVRDSDALRSRYIWSRDPEEYLINPPEYKPGIYRKNHIHSSARTGDVTLMPPGKFFAITFDPLYNNPYGQSICRPIAEWTETWDTVFDSWRMGLVKAGYGSWIGEYGPDLRGNDTRAVAGKKEFLDQVKMLANGTASIFDEQNKIRAEKLQFDAQVFLDFHESFVQAISVLMTGSATALIEGKFGSFAKEEATSVRQKSEKEQADALLMGAAFTYQFNRIWMHYNYGPDEIIPQLQLIRPDLIMPTTPQGQDTQEEITDEGVEVQTETEAEEEPAEMALRQPDDQLIELIMSYDKIKELNPHELILHASYENTVSNLYGLSIKKARAIIEMAEGEENTDKEDSRKIFDFFPDERPEPDIFKRVEDVAKIYLEALPVKNYNDVKPGEEARVFTIKRLRNFDQDAVTIQKLLKEALINTIGVDSEAKAWNQYLDAAENIFMILGLDLSLDLQSDLITSFRMARQSAYQAGINSLIEEEDANVTGIETVTMEDKRVRPVHELWNGIVLAPDDPRRKRLQKPMDFNCRCLDIPVLNNEKPLTPEDEIPTIFPGESFRGYVA
jgi:SPP1 gp7 family putative phage head morphogenesis protein